MGENSHIDEMLNQLHSNDLKYRQQAIDALSTHNVFEIASASLNELLIASVDSDDGMRASVAAALGKKADRGAVAVLTQRLTLDEAPKVRLRAARALGEINDPVALPALEVAFLRGDKDLSSEAALAIRRIGNADAANILINALSHANAFIRRSAAMQVGNLGDLTVIPTLEEALQDKEASVSIAA
ncbi:MAG TPA: HEAT repeat domain-containing protein [Edaphobacter sp.]|nr:HEAT repeat domain-containing protein [Edaphobacter sp.]